MAVRFTIQTIYHRDGHIENFMENDKLLHTKAEMNHGHYSAGYVLIIIIDSFQALTLAL